MTERNKRTIYLDGRDIDRADEPAARATADSKSQRNVRTMTLFAFARLYKVKIKPEDFKATGEAVARLCLEKGARPTEVQDERFGTVRLMPLWVFLEYFGLEG